jgi:hypothetical protein
MNKYIKKIVTPLLIKPILKNLENYDACFYRNMLGYQDNDPEIARKVTDDIANEIHEIECFRLKKTNCVCGWVPYLRGGKIVVYNFFGNNYAIRRNVLLRISICSKDKVISQKMFVLPPSQIYIDDLEDCDSGYILVAEIYHPRINTNHGGFNGHLRFWGMYSDETGGYSATTHSMPLPFDSGISRKQLLSRCISMSEEINNSHQYSLVGKSQLLPTNTIHRIKWHFGFVVTTNSSGGVEGVWHNSIQDSRQLHPSNKLKNADIRINEQSFYVPPIDNISVSIFIDPYETQIVNQEVSVSLFKNGICAHEFKKSLENINHLVLPSKFFHDNDNGTICVIKYKEDKTIFAYAHISFNINGIQGDLVHTHTHLPKIKGKSALKFMHFPCAKDSSLQSWIVVYKVGDRDTYKNEFNLRIFNQEGKESIFYFNFSKQDSIKAINLNELVVSGDDHYIVQLQSYCANYSASVFTYNNKTHQTATDHTSGG